MAGSATDPAKHWIVKGGGYYLRKSFSLNGAPYHDPIYLTPLPTLEGSFIQFDFARELKDGVDNWLIAVASPNGPSEFQVQFSWFKP